ncbi:MAG: sugar phosphate nucleotidyltransferase [Bdellovibrionia bacterium]
MSSNNSYLVIIAGGSGTRFWPKSTSKRPKQLLTFGTSTLLAQTVSRFITLVPPGQRLIVTTQALKDAIELEKLEAKVLGEPQGRNTAPCIYWAAKVIEKENPKGIMLVMPADHYMANPNKFTATVKDAILWAEEHGDLVTLGIKPVRPETGYGYLKTDPSPAKAHAPQKVEAFVEKPNLVRAHEFLASGNYLWNGGMFIWRVDSILQAFDLYMPEMKKAWETSKGKIEDAYPNMTATSIDYGIMEKAKNVVTFTLDCGWDDLGSWTSLENVADLLDARRGQNVVTAGDILAIESSGNIVDTPGRLTSLLGVNDLIVVEHGDAILIAHKDRAQDIRKVVDEVRKIRPELA